MVSHKSNDFCFAHTIVPYLGIMGLGSVISPVMIRNGWRDEFLRRYYLWSTSASVREYEAGLPLVRAIQSTAALVFVDYVSALTAVQLTALRTGLIKK